MAEFKYPPQGTTAGTVIGPGSSTDNAVARWNGVTGESIQNSNVIIDDTGRLTAVGLTDSTLTASRALATDGSKNLVSSATTFTELGYVSGVTSAIQTQIDSKQVAGNYITALTGGVTASGPGSAAATVVSVGGKTAAAVATSVDDTLAATSADTASTIMKRSSSKTAAISALDLTTGIADPSYQEGRLFYDNTAKTLAYYNDSSNVKLNIGQESYVRVRNNSGATITNGSAVYLTGEVGGIPTIALALATAVTTGRTIGIVTESIANNSNGYVTSYGIINALNTNAFTAGARIYLSATTPGLFTTTIPSAPNYLIPLGYILTVSPTTGQIFVDGALRGRLARGTANQLMGVDSTGLLDDYKSLLGTTNNISVTAAAGSLTLNTGSNIVSLTGTQTLTNKTLTAPVFNTHTVFTNISSPSTPSAGTLLLYSKSDNKLYTKDSNGAEIQVGAGASGGSINYILNPDAESSTTGWATYADAAGSVPVDGTGGSPASTFTRNTTTPLRGNADFRWTKSAANRQGEGFSYDFTISTVDRSKKLQISVDMNTSSTNYVAADMVCYVYDVTNATLITPSSTSVPKITGSFAVTFDSTTSTNYRLIFHTATTNATAYDLYFDNFIVGPGVLVQGAAIGDWQSWTPTGTWSTNTTYSGYYRRNGPNADFVVKIALSGAPTGTFTALNMPSGLTINTASLPVPTAADAITVGQATAVDSGTASYGGVVTVVNGTTTSVRPYILDDAAGGVTWSSITATAPFTFGSADFVTLQYSLPIAEWAGNGTVNLGAGAQVTYVSTGGTWDADVTGISYGPDGSSISGSLTAARTKTISLPFALQNDDQVTLEYKLSNGLWQDQKDTAFANNPNQALSFGGNVNRTSTSTSLIISFGQYAQSGTTFNSATGASNWASSNTSAWRVKIAKSSSPVGFGIANSNESGLVKPRRGQYSLTVTGTNWTTTRAVAVYYQDQDGNHRLKFNMRGTLSVAAISVDLTLTGVTFKNVTNFDQAVTVMAVGTAPYSGSGSTNPGNSILSVYGSSSTAWRISGDVELDSKPTWA